MEPDVALRTRPTSPVPPVVQSRDALEQCATSIQGGEGLVAVDAERAGSFRYTQRAYLVQLHRRGAGTWLIDPVAIDDFAPLADVLHDAPWVLHAASQDLPGLADLGLRPPELFDTELAGRLLNINRVGLAAMTEQYLGVALAKSHSAADWSKRPLPEGWLAYAALDVELLVDLAEKLHEELDQADRLSWALEEFEAIRLAPAPAPHPERWRRVKGLKARSPRSLAIVRELWLARDELARELDRSPTKVLTDAAINAAAAAPPAGIADLANLPGMTNESGWRQRHWLNAIQRAQALPADELPATRMTTQEPPNPRSWDRIDPQLAAGFGRVRESLTVLAENVKVPRENLLAPKVLRDSIWAMRSASEHANWMAAAEPDEVGEALTHSGARRWQVNLTTESITVALRGDRPSPESDITRE